MPSTITGAIKAILAVPLPGVPVFRDEKTGAVAGTRWIVVYEGLSRLPTAAETHGRRRRRELVQLDLWQQLTAAHADDETFAPTVERALDGAAGQALSSGDGLIRFRPESYFRSFDEKTLLLREAITVAVTRHLT